MDALERETIAAEEIARRIAMVVLERSVNGLNVPEPQAEDSAEEFQPLSTFPWRRAVPLSLTAGLLLPISERKSVPVDELLATDGFVFVANAYRALLGRDPDSEGLHVQLRRAESGVPKELVLVRLRYSAEGRRRGVRVAGLLPKLAATLAREFARRGPKPFLRRGVRFIRRFF